MSVVVVLFQFHKGAIRTIYDTFAEAFQGNFNSIKVRLEQVSEDCMKVLQLHFNSIKVRLEHDLFGYTKINTVYFNSIKVRLELVNLQQNYDFNKFQFHKGAIRTIVTPI